VRNLSGFRIDSSKFLSKLERAKAEIRLETFRPYLLDYVRKSLNAAIKLTPAREYQLIKSAQNRQYSNRINYIPTIHRLENPSLIAKGGREYLFLNGKWYLPDKWKLPDNVWNVYQQLLAERQRRMQTSRGDFIQHRAQARYLYKKSWVQVGASIGLDIRAPQSVLNSVTRRKPPKEPDKGYAQIRGGKTKLSVVIYNPFVTQKTAYWKGDGGRIILEAMELHRSNFDAQIKRHLSRVLYAIFHK